MNRIYVEISTEQIKSPDRARCYLAYILIRFHTKNQCGGFNFEKFTSSIGLKKRASKVLLNSLIKNGFVTQEASDHFRVVGHKKLFTTRGRQTYYTISDKELSKFSLKRIASFRAFLSELEIERYKRHQRSKVDGFSVTDQRSGQKEKVRNVTYREWDHLMACTCTAKLMGFSRSTAGSYKTRQNVSRYFFKVVSVKPDTFVLSSPGKEIKQNDFTGKLIEYRGKLLHFPIAERKMFGKLKRG